MIAAAIDIGTNTTLALLAERDGDGLRPLKDELTVNRLGEALKTGATLPIETITLNVDLLSEIVRDFRRAGAEDFVIAGTSALRRAQNRAEFVAAVKQIVGLPVEIIAGRDEAALTYLGALSGREVYPGEAMGVMDLGGGSTELVLGKGFVPGQSLSVDVGSVMLTNEFLQHDPPTANELQALRESLRRRLPALAATLRDEARVPWVLVGGTAVTLAILKAGLRRYEPGRIAGATLTREDIQRLARSFEGKTVAELQSLPGMPSGRGRSILAGTVLLDELCGALEIAEGTVSERGLRHGLWLAKFGKRDS